MRFEGPIDIRPLTMRGTFGIAWRLVRRNFASIFFYALLMQVIMLLGLFVVLSPVLGSIIKGNFEGFDFAIEIVIAVLLMLVYFLALVLLYNPIFSGTLYGELSSRMYADGASLGMLFRRTKFSLKRYFTTTMCLYVCGIAISIAESIFSSISGGIFGFAGLAATLPGALAGGVMSGPFDIFTSLGAGLFVFMGLMALLSMAIALCGQSFICFTYPVAANESVFNFDAVGRSIKLASKRFGRVLGSKLLFAAVVLGVEVVIGAIMGLVGVLTIDSSSVNAAWVIPILSVFALVSVFISTFAMVFAPALETVLYYDARTRIEGRAWLGMDQPDAPAQNDIPNPATDTNDETPAQQPDHNENANGGEHGA